MFIKSAAIALIIAALLQQPAKPQIDRAKLAAQVKAEFQHAWNGYKKYAWGHDDLLPVSKSYRDWYKGQTLYMTAVDSLDTMILMKMTDEAKKTQTYLIDNLKFDSDIEVQ